MHPKSPLGCQSCVRSQSCCKNLEFFPMPIMPDEVERYGEENVVRLIDGDGRNVTPAVYVALPDEDTGDCTHLVHGECSLGRSRPRYCKAYPVLYDGTDWYIDVGCPVAGETLFHAAISKGTAEYRFLRRAVMILWKVGKRMRPVIRDITSNWRFPLVIKSIPDAIVREAERRENGS